MASSQTRNGLFGFHLLLEPPSVTSAKVSTEPTPGSAAFTGQDRLESLALTSWLAAKVAIDPEPVPALR